jgi:hypothetical protein
VDICDDVKKKYKYKKELVFIYLQNAYTKHRHITRAPTISLTSQKLYFWIHAHCVFLLCSFPSSPYLLQTLGGAIKLSPQNSEIKQEQKRLWETALMNNVGFCDRCVWECELVFIACCAISLMQFRLTFIFELLSLSLPYCAHFALSLRTIACPFFPHFLSTNFVPYPHVCHWDLCLKPCLSWRLTCQTWNMAAVTSRYRQKCPLWFMNHTLYREKTGRSLKTLRWTLRLSRQTVISSPRHAPPSPPTPPHLSQADTSYIKGS